MDLNPFSEAQSISSYGPIKSKQKVTIVEKEWKKIIISIRSVYLFDCLRKLARYPCIQREIYTTTKPSYQKFRIGYMNLFLPFNFIKGYLLHYI